MKIKVLIILMLFTLKAYAQVGINTSNPDPSSVLDVVSNNKGITFPKVSLTSYTDVTTIPNPKESLIVYNTNENLGGKKAFYFWNGSKWDYMFSDTNSSNLENHVKYYSAISNTGYTFTAGSNSQFYGDTNHTIGEDISTNGTWTVISALTTNIKIDRTQNEILMNLNGMMQANNTTTGNMIFSSIGFFVDDKLVAVKAITMDFEENCNFRAFTIHAIANNISIGTHTVKFAIRNRSTTSTQSDLSVSFGRKNPSSSCNEITNDEAKLSSTIFVNQPYVF